MRFHSWTQECWGEAKQRASWEWYCYLHNALVKNCVVQDTDSVTTRLAVAFDQKSTFFWSYCNFLWLMRITQRKMQMQVIKKHSRATKRSKEKNRKGRPFSPGHWKPTSSPERNLCGKQKPLFLLCSLPCLFHSGLGTRDQN